MPQNNQENNQQGTYQIPRDFSATSSSNTVTALAVGQDKPLEENNPIYDTGGISWGALSLITFIFIVLGIIMVRYMNLQSWREFFLRPNARSLEHIQNDRDALKLIQDLAAFNKKFGSSQESS